MKISFKTIVMIFLVLFCFLARVEAKIGSAIKLDEHFKSNEGEIDYDEIEAKLWERVYEQPYNSDHYAHLAFFYDYIGDYEKELEALKNEVAYLRPESEDKDAVYGNLARAYMLNDKWTEGKLWLDKADEININNLYNRWNAFSYYTLHEFNVVEAAKQLSILDQMADPEDDRFFDGFDRLSEDENLNIDKAVLLFEEALRQNPDNPKAMRTLAAVLRFQAAKNNFSYERIYALLDRAIILAPDFIPTYLTMANARFLELVKSDIMKAKQEAFIWTQKAREIDPNNPKVDYTDGNYHLMTEQFPEAIELFKRAISNGFDNDLVHDSLANAYNRYAYEIYTNDGDLQKGLDLIDQAIEIKSEDGIILSTKAELLYKLGRYEEAWNYIQKGIEQYPDHKEIKKDYEMIKKALDNNIVPGNK